MFLVIYLLLGVGAGLSAGIFGIGGGLVIVPGLLYCFGLLGVNSSVAVHLAVGTSLATIVMTSISSVRAHHQLGNVDWLSWRYLAPGISVGVIAGVASASVLPGEVLQLVFALFAIAMSLQMGLGFQPTAGRTLPGGGSLLAVGGGVGFLSALFGIGGGSLMVPYLSWCNVRMQQAVATSAACGLPIAVFGAASNIVAGAGHSDLPPWSTGYVYWPAFFAVVICSAPSARLGAKIAQSLPSAKLKKMFAAFLFLVGCQLIYGVL